MKIVLPSSAFFLYLIGMGLPVVSVLQLFLGFGVTQSRVLNKEEQHHISALQTGNRESFKWLFEHYKTPLHSYIHSLLKGDEWTDDVCAEVFVAVWNNRQNIQSETFRSYLFQIARNKTFNQLKKIAADTRQEAEFIRRYRINQGESYENETLRYQEELLMQEIRKLPPKRKEIIERKYLQGQKNTQIAQDMGITIYTVKVHLYKARLYLKSRLGDGSGNL